MSAPPAKSGATICGVKLQVLVPDAEQPRELRAHACRAPAVSVMRGKNAARAAPMLAFAALSWCSAPRMSGRLSRTSEGSPAATASRSATVPKPSGRRRADGRADQELERVWSTATAPV